MATLKLRKRPSNPAAGAVWILTTLVLLLFGPMTVLVAATRNEHPALLPAGILVCVLAVMCAIQATRVKLRSLGPYQVELDGEELRDLGSGERIRWADVNSIRQTRDGQIDLLEILHRGNANYTLKISDLNHPVELITTTVNDLHRKAQGQDSLAAELQRTGTRFPCPVCGRESDCVKCYQYVSMVFVFVGYGYQTNAQVGCPSCTRKMIGKNLLVNLLTANLVWPFICLPWGVVLLIMSTMRGHSPSVLKAIAAEVIAAGNESQQVSSAPSKSLP